MVRLLVAAFLLVAPLGCAYTMRVTAQRDIGFQLNKSAPIYLAIGNDVSVDEKNSYSLLRDALQQSGFQVVDNMGDAKLVMTCRIAEEQKLYRGYATYPDSTVWLDSWGRPYWANSYWYPTWYSPWYSPRRVVYSYDQESIKLRLFDAAAFKSGKRIPLWEGKITGAPEAFEENLQQSFKALVDNIGDNYRGQISIKASN